MRNLGQIKELGKMIERVEKKGNVPFLSRDYINVYSFKSMDFSYMKSLGYLKVINTEYYDVEINKVVTNVYAVKGNHERIKIADNWREKEFAKKLGFEIVVEESNVDIVKGKRYTYKFDIETMKNDYNNSINTYKEFKISQAEKKVEQLHNRVERCRSRLNKATTQWHNAIDNVTKQELLFGLQLM